MRIGSKGVDTPTIIGIIIAVIVGIAILYILWAKGLLPFFPAVTETECTAYFMRGCQEGGVFDPSDAKYNLCKPFAQKYDGADMCFPGLGGTPVCEVFCRSLLQE